MKIVDNIFSEQELETIRQEYRESLQRDRWEINKFCWQENLTIHSRGQVLMLHVEKDEIYDIVLPKIGQYMQFEGEPNISFYLWNEGSGIGWHHDDHVRQACTIYLNDWPLERGGQLVYKEGNQNRLIPVISNRLVINDSQTEHQVTTVRRSNELRCTIQMFIK